MNGKPIHQNLSTSFVDLPAMIDHLRGLQFAGRIRVEFSSYEAEIIFTGTGNLQAREYDRLVGRIAQGGPAYRRILKRAKQPSGRVHVIEGAAKESADYIRKPFVDDRIIAGARQIAFGGGDRLARICAITLQPIPTVRTSENGEAVELAAELLRTVKGAFAASRLDFEKAFAKACAATADDHAFLDPGKTSFIFRNGEIIVGAPISNDRLFAGIVEALAELFGRMRARPKFATLLAFCRHRIQQHLSARNLEYERMELTAFTDPLLK